MTPGLLGGSRTFIKGDAFSATDLSSAFDQVLDSAGGLDGILYSVGGRPIEGRFGPKTEMHPEFGKGWKLAIPDVCERSLGNILTVLREKQGRIEKPVRIVSIST